MKIKVATIANYIEECLAFWTVVSVPENEFNGSDIKGLTVGSGETEAAAISDFIDRHEKPANEITVEVAYRDNVNIEMNEETIQQQ